MNLLTKNVIGMGLFAMSAATYAGPIEFTGEYDYLGSATSNFIQTGDPHNTMLIDELFNKDVDVIVVDGLSESDSAEILIQSLRATFNAIDEFSFNWTVEGTTPWDVVGLAVKAGTLNHYFELVPNIAVSATGLFNLVDELVGEGFSLYEIKAISHVDMFGVKTISQVPAPATVLLALTGLGLIMVLRKKNTV